LRSLLLRATYKDAMPSTYDITRHQKLLAMYRSLLVEYLLQHQQWPHTELPGYISASINVLRRHIMMTKGTLRGWKIAVSDLPDDEGPNDDIASKIQHQRNLLKIHRRNLATYLRQQKQLPAGQAPPMLVNGLDQVRSEIQRIKAILRGWGVPVDDLPEEEVE
jgi:hypothetical protein